MFILLYLILTSCANFTLKERNKITPEEAEGIIYNNYNLEKIKELDINQIFRYGSSLLKKAIIYNNNQEAIDILLEKGAEPNAKMAEIKLSQGRMPNYNPTINEMEGCIREEVKKKILRGEYGSIVDYCVENGLKDTLEKLLIAGASPNLFGISQPLDYNNSIISNFVCSPLNLAIWKKDKDICSTLLKYGADISNGYAFYHAAFSLEEEICQMILDRGFEMKKPICYPTSISGDEEYSFSSYLNSNILFVAIMKKRVDVCNLILNLGYNVHEKSDYYDKSTCIRLYPLLLSLIEGNEEISLTILSKLEDMSIESINFKHKDEMTYLMLASERGFSKVVTKLIQMGADRFIRRTKDQKLAINFARQNRHLNLIPILMQK